MVLRPFSDAGGRGGVAESEASRGKADAACPSSGFCSEARGTGGASKKNASAFNGRHGEKRWSVPEGMAGLSAERIEDNFSEYMENSPAYAC